MAESGENNEREQIQINFDPDYYLIKVELLELKSETDELAKEALIGLKSAEVVCDLGCGAGLSAMALGEICDSMKSLQLVDGKPVISNDIVNEFKESGIEVDTHVEQIQQFLKTREKESTDLFFFGAVVNNNLKEDDIQNMSDSLRDKGIVFETNDTFLNKQLMEKYFDKLYKWQKFSLGQDVIWRKKQH